MSDGLWMMVLEKAFGLVYPIYTHKPFNEVEPMDNINYGVKLEYYYTAGFALFLATFLLGVYATLDTENRIIYNI